MTLNSDLRGSNAEATSASSTDLSAGRDILEKQAVMGHTRPTISKQQTDKPKLSTKMSIFPPSLDRRRTNISLLNEAIWNPNNTRLSSDSSSSNDDSDENVEATQRQQYSSFNVGSTDYKTRGRVSRKDGRLNISLEDTSNRGYLVNALGATILKKGRQADKEHIAEVDNLAENVPVPKLCIVIMIIGSRGDVTPFLQIGIRLKEHGHRVRIASHPAFREFVQESGLEFFSVGGDPAELMAFMVKNPGMIPTLDTLKQGEIGRRRDQMAEMFEGFWRACINATDDEKDVNNMRMMGQHSPFVADAIIANPPSFAHIHCAERLGVPLHLMFTFPYTPTQSIPHPLSKIKKTNVDAGYANWMSYPLVEMMTWQGLGDLVNTFRTKTLGLEPVSTLWAPGQLYRLKVPYTYLWSPGLVPKPKDWGPEIDIAGFVFLDLAPSFSPPDELSKFLEAGDQPVYIGFGSIVVDDPDKFTGMILEAVKKAGVRAMISKGWGGLGGDIQVPDNVFMLDNTPHDWLFPKVSAVVHHGGAGTTAIGLKCGKPAMIVPFFGDQQFWGNLIGESGAGAMPIPHKDLDADKLAEGILKCLTAEAKEAAEEIAKKIEEEGDAAANAVKSFHRSLVLHGPHSMRCSILEDRVAVWNLKHTSLRLSALAAELLVERKKISWKQLRLIRHNEWNDFEGPGEPVTGGITAVAGTVTDAATGIGRVPYRVMKNSRKRAKYKEKKKVLHQKVSYNLERQKENTIAARHGDCTNVSKTRSARGLELQSGDKSLQNNAGEDEDAKTPHKRGEIASQSTDGATARTLSKRDDQKNYKLSEGNNHGISNLAKGREPPFTDQPEKNVSSKASLKEDRSQTSRDLDADSVASEDLGGTAAQDMLEGVGHTAEALARAPLDLTMNIAAGFHNAPRLYGDTTVRRSTRVTGYKSGFKAAGEEFTYGVYDGFTGVVTQPYNGARENGVVGFVKGTGIGLTGLVLKNISAIVGPVGYTLKGFHKQVQRRNQPTHFIRKARIVEGSRNLDVLDLEGKERAQEAVDHGWSVIKQVWAIADEKRAQGLRGRLKVMRERNIWRSNGAFENVEMAEKALEARERGEDIEVVFSQQRQDLKKAQSARKKVLHDQSK